MAQQKKTSAVKERAMDNSIAILKRRGEIQDAIFQHSVLCQTFLPYRDPGTDVRIWKQRQGHVSLAVQSSEVMNPETGDFEHFGIPYGTKARLILAHINSEAIRNQERFVEVEDSMSAFIKKLGLHVEGKTITLIKEQLRRLTSCMVSLGYADGGRGVQVDMKIVKAFDLWFPKDERQRILWTSHVELTHDYFESLIEHSIPLDERALGALSHNALAMDIYCWLAQRLHRVPAHKSQFVAWQNVKEQFGHNYKSMDKFKQKFRTTLTQVRQQYLDAKLEEEKNKGFWLHNSPSPIEKKTYISIPGTNSSKPSILSPEIKLLAEKMRGGK